jgi:hypothetical protein
MLQGMETHVALPFFINTNYETSIIEYVAYLCFNVSNECFNTMFH